MILADGDLATVANSELAVKEDFKRVSTIIADDTAHTTPAKDRHYRHGRRPRLEITSKADPYGMT
jgi:hypothetical protein